MAGKTSILHARIEPSVKQQAEEILLSLNMTASGAINLFYKQIVLHRGLPFEVKLPDSGVINMDNLSSEQLYEEVMKGVDAAKNNQVVPAREFFSALNKEFAL